MCAVVTEVHEVMISWVARYTPTGEEHRMEPVIVPQAQALERMRGFLKFDGKVSFLESEKITVETRPWLGRDSHTFEGSAEAMRPLFGEAKNAPRANSASECPAQN